MELHERLREYQKSHGLKQTWLAEQTGIPLKTLNGILNGRQRLTADVFEVICRKGFKVSPGVFFDGDPLDSKTMTGTDA